MGLLSQLVVNPHPAEIGGNPVLALMVPLRQPSWHERLGFVRERRAWYCKKVYTLAASAHFARGRLGLGLSSRGRLPPSDDRRFLNLQSVKRQRSVNPSEETDDSKIMKCKMLTKGLVFGPWDKSPVSFTRAELPVPPDNKNIFQVVLVGEFKYQRVFLGMARLVTLSRLGILSNEVNPEEILQSKVQTVLADQLSHPENHSVCIESKLSGGDVQSIKEASHESGERE